MSNRMRAATFTALMLATALPAIVNNTAVAQVQRPTKIASTVLATVNGQQLTQSMVDSKITFYEFIVDHNFTAADKRWLTDLEIKNFRNNPSEEIQAYRQIAQTLRQLKQSRDPVEIAYNRENLMAKLHLSQLANNIMYKYLPVIYTNPKYKIVITKRTVDSLFASNNFVAQLAGRPSTTPNYEGLAQYFRQLDYTSAITTRNLAKAESRWVRLQVAWSKASPQTQQQVVADIRQQVQRGRGTDHIARNLESRVTGVSNDNPDTVADLQTKINGHLDALDEMTKYNIEMQNIDLMRRTLDWSRMGY